MERLYIALFAAVAAVVALIFFFFRYLELPWWIAVICIAMSLFGILVLAADMMRPDGGSPDFKTSLLLIFLFLPIIPVLLPVGVVGGAGYALWNRIFGKYSRRG